jgi:hypothetical protein
MRSEATLIVQLARDGSVDRHLREEPPPSVVSGRVILDHILAGPGGRLGPPEAGEVVLSVLSPEAFARNPQEVKDAVDGAEESDEPPVILVEAAEELREDELDAVLDAADRAQRVVILRVMADA